MLDGGFCASVIISCSVGWLPVRSPTMKDTAISPQLSSFDWARQNFTPGPGSPYTSGPVVGDGAACGVEGALLGAPSVAGEAALLVAGDGAALVDDDDVEDVLEPHAARAGTVAMPR